MQKFLIQMFLLLIFLLSVWCTLYITLLAADLEAERYFENNPIEYTEIR